MNRDKLIKNIGCRVQLEPSAVELNDRSVPTPGRDDEWLIQDAPAEGLRVRNLYTDHVTTPGYDHIHHRAAPGWVRKWVGRFRKNAEESAK